MATVESDAIGNCDLGEESESEDEQLRCNECAVDFISRHYLHNHLLFHIRQPRIVLRKVRTPPIRLTIKTTDDNNFVVFSPSNSSLLSPKSLNGDPSTTDQLESDGQNLAEFEDTADESHQDSGLGSIEGGGSLDEVADVTFSPNFVGSETAGDEHSNEPHIEEPDDIAASASHQHDFSSIPGAEPTPPPEPSPDYPKIRIKTSGLLKESLSITELTDENQTGGYDRPEIVELESTTLENTIWATPSLEDPLKLPDSTEKDDNSIITNLFSNNDRAKDLGFTSSDNEYISLDRLDDHNNSRALQVYNSSSASSSYNSSPMDTLAGLPMQQLAEQVSRLQPGSSGGMHQQNVLINIQQFPQAPPQPPHSYQPPPMYPPHPHAGVQQPPLYPSYQYQPPPPPNMYYPPAPAYPPHMPPPRPQMPPQLPQQPMGQPMPSMQQPPQYRQPAMSPPRQPIAPRQPVPPTPNAPVGQRQPIPQRQPQPQRQRMPMVRPRGKMPVPMRAPRPRVPGQQPQPQQSPQNGVQGPRMVKRTPEQIQALQAKRKRMDVLVPDKHDDADCEVIAVQPKNTGLPQIQSVKGGAPDQNNANSNNGTDNSIMHLSDSITLSVRNPPPKPQSPKKSDAKAVANILATRGITVTATPKKDKPESPRRTSPPPPPVAINLNSAVSIIPSANKEKSKAASDTKLPTVDLTDDTPAETNSTPPPQPKPAPPKNVQRALPFRCDLCPAQYPNTLGLNKHRQSFHKTAGSCELGVPLIDLKQPGILQRLANIGIHNYIPITGASTDNLFALPVVNANNLKNTNLGALGASNVLSIGPIRTISKPQTNNNTNSK